MPFDFKLILPESAVPTFEMALEETAGAVLTRLIEKGKYAGHWELQAIFETEPDKGILKSLITNAALRTNISVPKLTLKKMPDINWLEASYQGFPPIEVRDFYIYGSHVKGDLPKDKITLQIDAATAFGTGEHQTTHGCLEALSDLTRTPKTVLDVGCGSGILGMAFAKKYHAPVDAVDIDPESVRVAILNAQKNGLQKQMTIWQSDGYQEVQKKYDLIFCNILAKPLIEMAPHLVKHLNPNGCAILSGFLIGQEKWVRKAHEKAGLKFLKSYRVNGWSTLVMVKEKS
ncbi:MAG: 50S ribosomal protein L11 methyltransferase [Alphaproteobacteria bacterium]|nr:50S ribosomal protein L11 methyltransferase [Alphaproteobacteria bacterium]